jgi:hypothetical protein
LGLRGEGGWWDGSWDECGKSFGILVEGFEGGWNVKIGMDGARRGYDRQGCYQARKGHEIAKIVGKTPKIGIENPAHSSNFKAGDDHA